MTYADIAEKWIIQLPAQTLDQHFADPNFCVNPLPGASRCRAALPSSEEEPWNTCP